MSNACYAVRDGDGGEGGAVTERSTSNARYAVRDGDRGECIIVIECIIFDICDTFWYNQIC